MKLPFLTRELIVVAQRRLAAALVLQIVLLAGVTLTWGLTAHDLTGRTIYEWVRVFQWGLLTTLMPWVAARCQAPDRGHALVVLSAHTARRPSSIVIAKIVSIAGVLALVAAAGVPPAIVAQQMSAVPASVVVRDLGSFVVLALLASTVTMGWLLATDDAIASWIGASVTIAVVLAVTSGSQLARLAQDVSTLLIAAAVAAALATWSDRSFQYCHE